MELDKVAGLEDIEDTEGRMQNTCDPHTWIDPLKIAEEGRRSSPKELGDIDQKIKVIMGPMLKSLKNTLRGFENLAKCLPL